MAKTKTKSKRTKLPSDDFPLAPRPRTSILTGVLCVLNILAAGAFLYIMMLDLDKRQQWKQACLLLELATLGVPSEFEVKGPAGIVETSLKPELGEQRSRRCVQGTQAGRNREGNLHSPR